MSDELHAADAVRSWVVLSDKLPVAVNCSIVPTAMVSWGAVTEMDVSEADLTVRVAVLVMPPAVAVIFAVPAATPVAFPLF